MLNFQLLSGVTISKHHQECFAANKFLEQRELGRDIADSQVPDSRCDRSDLSLFSRQELITLKRAWGTVWCMFPDISLKIQFKSNSQDSQSEKSQPTANCYPQLTPSPAYATLVSHLPPWEWIISQNLATKPYFCWDLWKLMVRNYQIPP